MRRNGNIIGRAYDVVGDIGADLEAFEAVRWRADHIPIGNKLCAHFDKRGIFMRHKCHET